MRALLPAGEALPYPLRGCSLPYGRYAIRRDARCRCGLVWIPLLAGALPLGLRLLSPLNAYPAAVLGVVTVCLLALALLSLPRWVDVSPEGIAIHCLLEVTLIPAGEIRAVELCSAPPRGFPLWSLPGFGGYCGYWLDPVRLRLFRRYDASRGPCLRIRRHTGCDIFAGADPRPVDLFGRAAVPPSRKEIR